MGLSGGKGDLRDGTLGILYVGGEGFDAVKAGLGERHMLLCPLCYAWSAGDRSYSTLEAYGWWGGCFDVVPWLNLFSVGFDDVMALVRLLVLPH